MALHATHDVAGLAFFLALVLFVTLIALRHMTGRRRWTQREVALVQDLNAVRAKLDRAEMFLAAEPQVVIAWGRTEGDPDIEGDLSLVTDAPFARRVPRLRILARAGAGAAARRLCRTPARAR